MIKYMFDDEIPIIRINVPMKGIQNQLKPMVLSLYSHHIPLEIGDFLVSTS